MHPRWARLLGPFLIGWSISLLLGAIINHKALWTGIIIKEKVVQQIDPNTTPKDSTTLTDATIQKTMYSPEKTGCNGEGCIQYYQFKSANSDIRIVKFCDPFPMLDSSRKYDITYIGNSWLADCSKFVRAVDEGAN